MPANREQRSYNSGNVNSHNNTKVAANTTAAQRVKPSLVPALLLEVRCRCFPSLAGFRDTCSCGRLGESSSLGREKIRPTSCDSDRSPAKVSIPTIEEPVNVAVFGIRRCDPPTTEECKRGMVSRIAEYGHRTIHLAFDRERVAFFLIFVDGTFSPDTSGYNSGRRCLIGPRTENDGVLGNITFTVFPDLFMFGLVAVQYECRGCMVCADDLGDEIWSAGVF